jgi:protein tyrosine kinase modulator
MLPGKTYLPEDLLRIARRRIWFILVPFAVIAACTAVVAKALPDRYMSTTLILVVPQRVPAEYVRSTITANIQDRLQSIAQQILSRTRLERIIQDFNLYVDERRSGIMEDIVDEMRADIHVDVVKGDAFRISYAGDEPRTVMKVTDRLASLFIEENLRDREILAEGTNQFLESQLEDARRRLIEQERKLEAYRRQFSGELPSQLGSNLQVIQNMQLQIQQLGEGVNRDRDRRLVVERQLADLNVADNAAAAMGALEPAPAPTNGEGLTGTTAAQQLESAKAILRGQQLRLKAEHPEIRRWQSIIRDLEKKAEAEALSQPVSDQLRRRPNPAEAARQNRLAELRAELEQLDRQIAKKQSDEAALRVASLEYQRRVEASPTRESEMIELTRDYTTLQTMYTDLLRKREDSKISANLERRQIGEQFRLLDPARMPERPFSPNRQRINMMGLLGGLAVGLGLVALLEYRDSSFKTDEEVTNVLALPVLAVVPVMQSDAERRRAFRWHVLTGLGLGSMVAVCLAVVIYTFVY